MTQHTMGVSGFDKLGLSPKLLAVLQQNKFIQPTPIQEKAIPVVLAGKDIIGIAQTGTGKTLAFGLPMLERLARSRGQGLVLVPTRELALQVDESLQKIGRSIGLKTAVVIGGASMREQLRRLRLNPHIIVATPGRLVDHIGQRTVSLQKIHVVVLDEADRMFDIGFAPQIREILSLLPKERQTLLFSATMPHAIAALASQTMKSPVRVEIEPAGTVATLVDQAAYIIPQDLKIKLLEKLLVDNPGTVLIFSRTKHRTKKITNNIRMMGHTAAEIHSDRSLAQRRHALDGFKTGLYRVLVATDIAARGIDVQGITLVINFDLPDNAEDYVHRIGRTGRAGKDGRALSFVAPEQQIELRDIQRIIRKNLSILPHTIPFAVNSFAPARKKHQPRRDAAGYGGQRRKFNSPPKFGRAYENRGTVRTH